MVKKHLITGIRGQDGLFLSSYILDKNEKHEIIGISRNSTVDLFFKKQVKHIIITRPAVEAGEKLGFLPGGLEEKLETALENLGLSKNDEYPGIVLVTGISNNYYIDQFI